MSSSISAEKFGLWTVVRLPTFTKRVIHPVIGKVIILEVEIVEIVTSWLNLLSMKNSDELRFSLFECDHHLGFFCTLNCGFCLSGQFVVASLNFIKL